MAASGFLAGAFFAGAFFAGAFLAGVGLAGVFLTGAFFPADFAAAIFGELFWVALLGFFMAGLPAGFFTGFLDGTTPKARGYAVQMPLAPVAML